jgi:Flp pilus assembly pilin Flp
VEYALIIALVAIVVIAIGAILGLTVQRGFGLVTGALGGVTNAPGALEITHAYCGVRSGQTGMRVIVMSTIDPGQLEVHTDKTAVNAFDSDGDGVPNVGSFSVYGSNPNMYIWNPMVDDTAENFGKCPVTIFIRTKQGSSNNWMASAPVVKKDCNAYAAAGLKCDDGSAS